jgi:DNA adenine methylase
MIPQDHIAPTPFIKWVGGKRQLQNKLLQVFEQSGWDSQGGTYFEPFLGGGAILLAVMAATSGSNVKARVADVNLSLLQTYKAIKSDFKPFLDELDSLEIRFAEEVKRGHGKDYFLASRDEFNFVKHQPNSTKIDRDQRVRVAALFVFLNKAGFNGLYRESRAGNFNVPFGQKSRLNLYDLENLKRVRKILSRTTIVQGDYKKVLEGLSIKPKSRDLIYFDPPYEPLTKTAAFTSYSHSGFNTDDQLNLSKFAGTLGKQGCRIVISNSSAKHLREFYWEQNFNIYEVKASRLVSAKSEGRKPVYEIIVTNFKINNIEGLRLIKNPKN